MTNLITTGDALTVDNARTGVNVPAAKDTTEFNMIRGGALVKKTSDYGIAENFAAVQVLRNIFRRPENPGHLSPAAGDG